MALQKCETFEKWRSIRSKICDQPNPVAETKKKMKRRALRRKVHRYPSDL